MMMNNIREVTGRYFGVDEHRSRPVHVVVRGEFAGAEEYLKRTGMGVVRTCDVLLRDCLGQHRRFVIYYTAGGAASNRAVAAALDRHTCGEFLVLGTHVNGNDTRYANLRAISQANDALKMLLVALAVRPDGEPYPRVIG